MSKSPSVAAARPVPQADAAGPPTQNASGLLLVFVAGLLYASAGLFTRALPFDAWTLLAWRSLAGGVTMALLAALEAGRVDWRAYAPERSTILLVPAGALATISYVIALKLTTVADVMIVYATVPFVAAGLGWVWIGEVPSRRLVVASTVALVGVAIMIGGGGAAPNRLAGAGLVMVMNICFAALLVAARRAPTTSLLPVNALALLVASAIGFLAAPVVVVDAGSLALMVLFGVMTVGLAMALFMAGARRAPSAEVALVGISDVVLGPLMVFLAFGENPGPWALAGGSVVVGALVWNLWPEVRRAMRRRGSITI